MTKAKYSDIKWILKNGVKGSGIEIDTLCSVHHEYAYHCPAGCNWNYKIGTGVIRKTGIFIEYVEQFGHILAYRELGRIERAA